MIAARRIFLTCALLIAGTSLVRAATVPTNAAANLVLGQLLFTTNTTPTPANASGLNAPRGVSIDPISGKVFIADSSNNRVLRYASQAALTNGALPEIVIGQVNFSSSSVNQGLAGPTQTTLNTPSAVFVDLTGRLWVADTGNNRVLLFENAASISNTAAADRVYGQPNFTTIAPFHNQTTLAAPQGVSVDPAGTLWVADTGSHRVMAFKNAATLANGAPADRVLGQLDFNSAVGADTQSGMFIPTGVSADADHVWVADNGNNRVLMYLNFPTRNGQNAGLVLGQAAYNTNTAATSASGMINPNSVTVAGSSLWVSDDGNNRELRFDDAAASSNGAAAIAVVGQATLLTGTPGTTPQKLSLTNGGVSVDVDGNLFVADELNNRVLRFPVSSVTPTPTPTPTPAPPTLTVSGKTKVNISRSTYTLRGTAFAASGIRRVSYNLNNQGYIFAKGATNWSAKLSLPFGRSKVIVNSVAIDGSISAPQKIIISRN